MKQKTSSNVRPLVQQGGTFASKSRLAKSIALSLVLGVSGFVSSQVQAINYTAANDTVNINTAYGNVATASGTQSVAVGGLAKATGKQSVAVGGVAKADADYTIAVGFNAQANSASEVVVGRAAGSGATHQDYSLILGTEAGQSADGTSNENKLNGRNLYMGYQAGNNSSGGRNTFIGSQNAGSGAVGDLNIGIGQASLQKAKGNENTVLGAYSGQDVNGSYNTSVGTQSGKTVIGDNNTALGRSSGQTVTGSGNTVMGANAGSTVTGNDNIAMGNSAGNSVIGYNNTAIGKTAGQGMIGKSNVAVGTSSGKYMQGDMSVAIGNEAGFYMQNATKKGDTLTKVDTGVSAYEGNVAIGNRSGNYIKGDGNVFLGGYAGTLTNNQQNVTPEELKVDRLSATASASSQAEINGTVGIGAQAVASGSGSTVIGYHASSIRVLKGGTYGDEGYIAPDVTNPGVAQNNIAFGYEAKANATKVANTERSIAFGYQANVDSATSAIAIGDAATTVSDKTIVIGSGSKTVAQYRTDGTVVENTGATGSIVIGAANTIDKENVVALGNEITKTAANSVFLGKQAAYVSESNRTKGLATDYTSMTLGDTSYAVAGGNEVVGVVSVGSDTETRRIQNVAPGLVSPESTDAINGSQLYAVSQKIDVQTQQIQANTERLDKVSEQVGANAQSIRDLRKESRKGDAMNAALAALKPVAYNPAEPTQIMAGVGTYRGEQAVAIGAAHYVNGRTMLNAGIAYAGNSDVMANIGVTWRVGQGEVPEDKAVEADKAAAELNSRVQSLEQTVNEQREQIEKLMALLQAK